MHLQPRPALLSIDKSIAVDAIFNRVDSTVEKQVLVVDWNHYGGLSLRDCDIFSLDESPTVLMGVEFEKIIGWAGL